LLLSAELSLIFSIISSPLAYWQLSSNNPLEAAYAVASEHLTALRASFAAVRWKASSNL
jgi:hypothetical protein